MDTSVKSRMWDDIIPVMAVKDNVMISRRGDLTLGWELTLPPAFSMMEDEYDAVTMRLYEAVRKVQPWTIIHRQDVYTYDRYVPKESGSFLGSSFENHFGGRRSLSHRAFLFLTLSSKQTATNSGASSGLLGYRFSASMPSPERIQQFILAADEFISSAADGVRVKARRLDERDLSGEGEDPGIIQRCAMLQSANPLLSDFSIEPDSVSIDGRKAIAFTMSEAERMSTEVSTVSEVESLSGEGGHMCLSYTSAVGMLLDCEHVVNQYILVEPQDVVNQRLERKRKRMSSDFGSSDNRVNGSQIGEYLDEVQRSGLFTVMSHLNVIAWDSPDMVDALKSKVSSALSSMSVTAAFDRFNTPILWYAGIPGAEAELGYENYMTMELGSALCLSSFDTFEREVPAGLFKVVDRMRGVPLTIDVQCEARDRQWIDNYNAFVLGGSGTGKSFFTNFYLRNCYDAGEHIFIIDVGDSYEGLCSIIHEESGGRDGIYNSWDIDHPFRFNPFIGYEQWLDERGSLRQDCNGSNFLLSFLQTAWAPELGWSASSLAILRQMITDFIVEWRNISSELPVFDDFYTFLQREVSPQVASGSYSCCGIRVGEMRFDMTSFLLALQAYSRTGSFSFLLNEKEPDDLFASRFTVFEVDTLSQVNDKKFYSLCILCIMNAFDTKMRQSPDFKVMVIEEAWKAIANETMSPYLAGLFKTSRKFRTSAMVVTQQVSDILSSEIIRDTILQNSSVRMLLDQSNNRGCFSQIEELLGLTEKDRNLVFSINKGRARGRRYKEVFIKLGDSRSGVYAIETSPEEAVAFESDKVKKRPFKALSQDVGCIEAARTIANNPNIFVEYGKN